MVRIPKYSDILMDAQKLSLAIDTVNFESQGNLLVQKNVYLDKVDICQPSSIQLHQKQTNSRNINPGNVYADNESLKVKFIGKFLKLFSAS